VDVRSQRFNHRRVHDEILLRENAFELLFFIVAFFVAVVRLFRLLMRFIFFVVAVVVDGVVVVVVVVVFVHQFVELFLRFDNFFALIVLVQTIIREWTRRVLLLVRHSLALSRRREECELVLKDLCSKSLFLRVLFLFQKEEEEEE